MVRIGRFSIYFQGKYIQELRKRNISGRSLCGYDHNSVDHILMGKDKDKRGVGQVIKLRSNKCGIEPAT